LESQLNLRAAGAQRILSPPRARCGHCSWRWRCAALAAAVAAPFLLSAFFEPAFLWYPAAVLASFAWFVYLSSRLYGALWGFLYAIAVGLLHLAILAALNAASGGLLWRAYEVGFDVYERWNVPVVTAADSAAMWASAEALARPWRRLARRAP
jgi:hypothetical protein